MSELLTSYILLAISVLLTAHAGFTLYLMLYTWWRPERLSATRSPSTYEVPRLRFTALLPARHEEAVIAETIARVWDANYPRALLEVVVICEAGDVATIAEAQRAIDAINHPNVRLATFSDGPVNKPHGLNVGLRLSQHEIVTVFDAEDDVHPDIFQIVNTIMLREKASIVQAGVQLMDFNSHWYAPHNVLEYFFWFRSRLHYHASVGMVPLGGNTVFMARRLIQKVGGWDEYCLTEDADIGLRLSAMGERIAITYDAEHATREETPPTLKSFVKQRTRWNQGFLQVLGKQSWLDLPTWGQRALAAYTLAHPFFQAAITLLWPASLVMMVAGKAPVPLAMVSFLPLYALAFQFLLNLVGLAEFGRAYDIRIGLIDVIWFTVGFLPYQALLGLGAVRAVFRTVTGASNWEKTEHTGAHRSPAAPQGAVVAVHLKGAPERMVDAA
ncbi:MAG: glycosyltransferase [Chloroflexi bacterium]|nr:glycosyltransferase [Chloroflexota bacterium]MBV9544712.1 glycosyltransferase [Chloroflexota bacterium]